MARYNGSPLPKLHCTLPNEHVSAAGAQGDGATPLMVLVQIADIVVFATYQCSAKGIARVLKDT
jgi:hypothetical protein